MRACPSILNPVRLGPSTNSQTSISSPQLRVSISSQIPSIIVAYSPTSSLSPRHLPLGRQGQSWRYGMNLAVRRSESQGNRQQYHVFTDDHKNTWCVLCTLRAQAINPECQFFLTVFVLSACAPMHETHHPSHEPPPHFQFQTSPHSALQLLHPAPRRLPSERWKRRHEGYQAAVQASRSRRGKCLRAVGRATVCIPSDDPKNTRRAHQTVRAQDPYLGAIDLSILYWLR
ncbi:hypothetical protein AZE42_10109 [Rhizopogon vesiculosus]|uniref:Uncharacterized protein n=1 Tax=Rhizopogon vesiculosus TaxID=180088 RepID=A0A1J8Q2W6_9AGAM|nr:hypothetical protein AZE42_10109 [Rhizopogon vesiculosus]